MCSLCDTRNAFSWEQQEFSRITTEACPFILLSNVVDLQLRAPPVEEEESEEHPGWSIPKGFPVTIALLDTHCDTERLECIKNSIIASLDVLPPDSLFGLISFDDRIRLYDVKGSVPMCRSLTMLEGVPLLSPLEDGLPLEQLLAPVGRHKEMITETLNHIRPVPFTALSQGGAAMDAPSQASVSRTETEPFCKGRGFGTVLQALLQYLQPLQSTKEDKDSKEEMVSSARVMSFLTGPPTMGLGNLLPYMSSKERFRSTQSGSSAEQEFKQVAGSISELYNQTALVAASLGVVLDLFLLPSEPVCLEILRSLTTLTGGDMWLYSSVSFSMMTQDLFHHLSTLHAQGCLLRIRLPPQLSISKSYGRLMKDPLYEDLYHILCCDAYETFCLDMEHTADLPESMTIQVAFQYTVPVFISVEGGSYRFELQRRLRLATHQVSASNDPTRFYHKIKANVIISFLMHKVMVAAKGEGILRAAVLLQDWLIILSTSFTKHTSVSKTETIVESEAFQPLIRLVYGLLRSPHLLGRYMEESDDKVVFLEHLWASLPPNDLQRAIYPQLMSFWSPHDKAFPQHSLSRIAMKISQAPVFLLDAYDTIMVLYTKDSEMSYPPLPSTTIRQTVKELRQHRKRMPQYLAMRDDTADVADFYEMMLDESKKLDLPSIEGESAVVFNGYLQFVDWIKYASEDFRSK